MYSLSCNSNKDLDSWRWQRPWLTLTSNKDGDNFWVNLLDFRHHHHHQLLSIITINFIIDGVAANLTLFYPSTPSILLLMASTTSKIKYYKTILLLIPLFFFPQVFPIYCNTSLFEAWSLLIPSIHKWTCLTPPFITTISHYHYYLSFHHCSFLPHSSSSKSLFSALSLSSSSTPSILILS